MNTLVRKEIRLLQPAFSLALLLAVLPAGWLAWKADRTPSDLLLYPLWLGAVMLALSSFGREFGLHTFPFLMSQPLERRRIWRTKIAVLAGAMLILMGAWLAAGAALYANQDWLSTGMPILALLGAAVAFSGGLWAALLLRQVAAAFWFTLLIPGAILMSLGFVGSSEILVYAVMGLYAVVSFLWAGWLFSRAQEVTWTGGLVDFSRSRAFAAGEPVMVRARRPWSALLKKELQLHVVNWVGIGGLCLWHLGVLLLRRSHMAASGSVWCSVLELFGAFWFIVPLIVASTSVAEERKLGTHDELLCLPVSSRGQFLIKLLVVLGLGGVLPATCLWTIEGLGTVYGASANIGVINMSFSPAVLRYLVLLSLGLALVSFYASTLCRHLVQAMAAAVAASIAASIIGSR